MTATSVPVRTADVKLSAPARALVEQGVVAQTWVRLRSGDPVGYEVLRRLPAEAVTDPFLRAVWTALHRVAAEGGEVGLGRLLRSVRDQLQGVSQVDPEPLLANLLGQARRLLDDHDLLSAADLLAGRPLDRLAQLRRWARRGATGEERADAALALAQHLLMVGTDVGVALALLKAWGEARCRPALTAEDVEAAAELAAASLLGGGVDGRRPA